MSAKHTPGPWIAEARSSHEEMSQSTLATVAWVGDYRVRVGIETGVKGGNYRDGLRGDEMADAHLIAAAPELLAEAIADDGLAVFIERTLAAVALPSGHPEVARAFADIRCALAVCGVHRRAAIAKAEGRQ